MLFEELTCYNSVSFLRLLKCRVSAQNIVVFILLTLSFKSSWHVLAILKDRKCSSKKVFLKLLQIRKTMQPTFQRRFNVVWTLWINVEITLTRRWKWNKIRGRIFNVANVDTTSVPNAEATLKQRCTTLVQR